MSIKISMRTEALGEKKLASNSPAAWLESETPGKAAVLKLLITVLYDCFFIS
jgi:hypothetical protein